MMNYKGDVGLYLSGAQVAIPQCGFFIVPPSIKDIELFGEDEFLTCVKIMMGDAMFIDAIKQSAKSLADADDFIVILSVINSDQKTKERISGFLSLIAPDFEIEIATNCIKLLYGEERVVRGQLQQFNFQYFAIVVKELFWPPVKTEDQFNPANEAAKEIARKLEAGRRKAQGQTRAAGESTSIFGTYASIVSIGLGISLTSVYEYTPFQLFDAFNRFMLKVQYDLYMKIKTTPMMSTENMEEPENWMSNIYSRTDGAM